MPTYKRCGPEVQEMADDIMREYPDHQPLIDAELKIDFLFAEPEYNENGEPASDAITHHGCKALGLTRKMSLKDRAAGRGDVEILLDGYWWRTVDDPERAALLDHELHHIAVTPGKTDNLRRPIVKLRKHDVDIGWFALIAHRHGEASQERKQARSIMESHGQFFWPQITGTDKIEEAARAARGNTVTIRTAAGEGQPIPEGDWKRGLETIKKSARAQNSALAK